MVMEKGQDFCTFMHSGNLVVVKSELFSDEGEKKFSEPEEGAKIWSKHKPLHKSFDLSKGKKDYESTIIFDFIVAFVVVSLLGIIGFFSYKKCRQIASMNRKENSDENPIN